MASSDPEPAANKNNSWTTFFIFLLSFPGNQQQSGRRE
jgi:hypothetical protein